MLMCGHWRPGPAQTPGGAASGNSFGRTISLLLVHFRVAGRADLLADREGWHSPQTYTALVLSEIDRFRPGVEWIYADIDAKRRTAIHLHCEPLLVEPL